MCNCDQYEQCRAPQTSAEDAALGEAMVASKREEMDREIDHVLITQSENLRRYWEVSSPLQTWSWLSLLEQVCACTYKVVTVLRFLCKRGCYVSKLKLSLLQSILMMGVVGQAMYRHTMMRAAPNSWYELCHNTMHLSTIRCTCRVVDLHWGLVPKTLDFERFG